MFQVKSDVCVDVVARNVVLAKFLRTDGQT